MRGALIDRIERPLDLCTGYLPSLRHELAHAAGWQCVLRTVPGRYVDPMDAQRAVFCPTLGYLRRALRRRRVYTEKAMAQDYYPLLARAIASLEQNTADARQTVYDHARRVLREQVRDLKPALSVSERMDEMLALEEAIRKVEPEVAGGP